MKGREGDEEVPSIAVPPPPAGCEEEGFLWGRQQEETSEVTI